MILRTFADTKAESVAMQGVAGVSMKLLFGRRHGAPNFAMRHFTLEAGGHTAHHQHDYEHEVFVLAGEGQVEADGTFRELKQGDAVLISPGITHQFVNTSNDKLEFICVVPTRFGDDDQETPET